MGEELLRLDKLIGHRPLGRILKEDEIAGEFEMIRRAFEAGGKKPPDATKFQRAGEACGTHMLKLITPRAEIGQHMVRIPSAKTNLQSTLWPSIDAQMAPVTKLIFRPWETVDYAQRSLVDHIRNPDDLSPLVTKGFSDAFGADCLNALQEALTNPIPDITLLPAAEFPIIFVPRPGGGDLQVTPIAPAEAYVRFRDVTEAYFRKQDDGGPPVPRGRWHRQQVTSKPQNISSAVGPQRTRFRASMPRVLDLTSAEFHRYANGGRFPMWRDESVVKAVASYASLLDRSADYSNEDIRSSLEYRADELIGAAGNFIDETLADLEREYPNIERRGKPTVVAVILNRAWLKDGWARARRVLSSEYFKARLDAARER